MARVVKKVKKTKEQRQKRNILIAKVLLGVAAITTLTVLLVMFITRTQPAMDPFSDEDFDDFRIESQQQFLDILPGATEYIFIFVYDSEAFDKEYQVHIDIYDNVRNLINEEINPINETDRYEVDFTFAIINLSGRDNNGELNFPHGLPPYLARIFGSISDFSFITLVVDDRVEDGYSRINMVHAPTGTEDLSEENISSTASSGVVSAIATAIGFMTQPGWER